LSPTTELFQTTKQNIAKHLKAIFAEGELVADSVVNQWLTTAADGKSYRVSHYNLEASRLGLLLPASGRRLPLLFQSIAIPFDLYDVGSAQTEAEVGLVL
jgi:hypothetical protein